jgi:hypothetical protein
MNSTPGTLTPFLPIFLCIRTRILTTLYSVACSAVTPYTLDVIARSLAPSVRASLPNTHIEHCVPTYAHDLRKIS